MTLLIGHDCSEEIVVDGLDLPASADLVMQFRSEREGPVLMRLATADGTLVVEPPSLIRLLISKALTARLPTTPMLFDCVRIDGTSAEFLGFEGLAQFHMPVTRLTP